MIKPLILFVLFAINTFCVNADKDAILSRLLSEINEKFDHRDEMVLNPLMEEFKSKTTQFYLRNRNQFGSATQIEKVNIRKRMQEELEGEWISSVECFLSKTCLTMKSFSNLFSIATKK